MAGEERGPRFANRDEPGYWWDWCGAVVPPKTSRGYETPYREDKIAAHTTVNGRGKIARLRERKKA